MFMFDIETLSVESTTIILSAAIIEFHLDEPKTFQEYLDNSCFVKFDVQEQISMGRTRDKGTLDWWKNQADIPKQVSLLPSENDLSAKEGISTLKKYIADNGGEDIIWARGSLDQMAIDSLSRAVYIEPLVRYNMWRDVRTAVDLLSPTAKDGYCKIKNFNPDLYVIKHDPRHDCALDVMMLTQFEE